MVEKAVKINEKLAAKGKRLEEINATEFDDLALSVGCNVATKSQQTGRRF